MIFRRQYGKRNATDKDTQRSPNWLNGGPSWVCDMKVMIYVVPFFVALNLA